MKKLILLILTAVLCASMVSASEIPSLFHNDDAWYKDGVSPMIERDGRRYIPADIFTMFDYMSVTTPTGNNLLIHNTDTGSYVSILFLERSALINGEVHENIGVFRDGGVYYVESDTVCEGLGFTTRLYIRDDGGISMQICDTDVISTSLTQLVQSYLPAGESNSGYEEEPPEPEQNPSRAAVIYLFCAEPDSGSEFTAQKILKEKKLEYTMFFDGDSEVSDVIRHSVGGICGLSLPENTADPAAELDEINRKFSAVTRKRVCLTVSSGDDGTDEKLREAGYCPVKPDFEINGGSDPDSITGRILALADARGWCTVWLDDCWNTTEIVRYLSTLDETKYTTANFGQTAPEHTADE